MNGRSWRGTGLMMAILGALALFCSSCGPMNGDKKSDSGTGVGEASQRAAGIGATQLSRASKFYVYAGLSGGSSGVSTASRAQLGDNAYTFRFAHAQDLSPPSSDATVNVSYFMPSMPSMGTSDAAATRQPDGSFAATLFFSMAGKWQVMVKFQDGSAQDEYVFEASL